MIAVEDQQDEHEDEHEGEDEASDGDAKEVSASAWKKVKSIFS